VPPFSSKLSRPRIASSSSVSRQSAENPGATIAILVIPVAGSSSSGMSVAGSRPFARPKRYWNDTTKGFPNRSPSKRPVFWQWQ
jgi:hypothetical protein